MTHSRFGRYTYWVKTRYVGGLVVVVAGLSFEACSSAGVGFTSPGIGGTSADGGGAPAGAGRAGGNGGASVHAGASGGDDRGGRAGDAGDAGTFSDGGEGGVPNFDGAGGAPHAGAGGAHAGAGGAYAGAGGAYAGAGGAYAGAGGGGASGAGGGGAGAPHAGTGGGGASGAGGGGAGAPHAGTGGGGASGAGPGGAGPGGAGGNANPNPVCGNALLESGEQCDDGNTTPLDSCDAACAFEESQRANWFKVQFDPDAFCSANRFGSAFPTLSRSVLQQSVDARVADGSFSLLFAFLGLADPKGPNGSSFSLGVLNGSPVVGTGYDGKSDLDWWYTPASGTVDANKSPLSKLSAQISAGVLSASGAKLLLPLISALPLSVSSAQLRLSIGPTSKPLASTGAPPGHLAAEHLASTLTSFASGGAQSAAGAGELCGNIGAASLKSEQIPPDYLSGGSNACAENYTASNTFLDMLVGGCTVYVGPFATTVLVATQPDAADPNVNNPGSGAPYKLSVNAARVVNVCRDKSGVAVNLASCLAAAAYSSAFKLATDRVIIK